MPFRSYATQTSENINTSLTNPNIENIQPEPMMVVDTECYYTYQDVIPMKQAPLPPLPNTMPPPRSIVVVENPAYQVPRTASAP